MHSTGEYYYYYARSPRLPAPSGILPLHTSSLASFKIPGLFAFLRPKPLPPPPTRATAMASIRSSLSAAAPSYIPKSGAPRIPPPPHAPGLVTYVCMPQPPPPEYLLCPPPEFLLCPPPGFLPSPPLAPPPPLPPCWSAPQAPCVPAGVVYGAEFLGGVVLHGHGAMAMAPPDVWPLRRHPEATRMQQRAAATAASCGVKAAVHAKDAPPNQPSPRSVLLATSPPISPTTSLPTSFPYRLELGAPPPATAGTSSAVEPSPAEGTVALRPPHGPRWRPRGGRRRARHPVFVRHTVKPRRFFDPSSERTSLMIRNIPNDFTRKRLMNILDQHCFIENQKIGPIGVRSEYDFLYVSIDFRKLANKGYAFVNMTSPVAARRLWEDLNGHRWAFKSSAKTCAVDYAVLQGLDELVEHFSQSRFDCHTEEFLPVRFEPPRDGTRPAEGAMHVVGRLGRPRARDGK